MFKNRLYLSQINQRVITMRPLAPMLFSGTHPLLLDPRNVETFLIIIFLGFSALVVYGIYRVVKQLKK